VRPTLIAGLEGADRAIEEAQGIRRADA